MRSRRWRWVFYGMLGAVVVGWTMVCTAVLLFVLHQPSLRVVATWESPAGVRYKDYEPYFLSVVETDLDFQGFPLHVERNFIVYVGRERGKPTYGHMVKHSFNPTASDGWLDVDRAIRRCTVVWSPEGVTLEEGSGHRLFIPGDWFGGGR